MKKVVLFTLILIFVLSIGVVQANDEAIVIGIHESPWFPAFKVMVDKYEEDTGNEIELLKYPHPSLMENQMIAARENKSTFDIISTDDSYLPFFVGGDKRHLTPLTEIDPDFKLPEDIISFDSAITWSHEKNYSDPNGVLYAIPTQGNFQMFFYNGDMFKEAGLSAPDTWSDVKKAAEILHEPPIYGYATTTVHKIQAVYFWMPILRSFGGDIFANPPEDWTVTIDSDAAKKSMEWILDMKEFCPPGIGNTSQSDVLSYLGNGQLVQGLNVTAVYPFMDDPDYSQFPRVVDFARVPAGPDGRRSSTIGNWLAMIPQASQRKEAALDFLKWFLKPENQVEFGENGGIPSSKKAIEILADRNGEEWRFFRAYLDAFNDMEARPRISEWPRVEDIMGTYFQRVITGDISVEKASTNMAKEISEIMKAAGYDAEVAQ